MLDKQKANSKQGGKEEMKSQAYKNTVRFLEVTPLWQMINTVSNILYFSTHPWVDLKYPSPPWSQISCQNVCVTSFASATTNWNHIMLQIWNKAGRASLLKSYPAGQPLCSLLKWTNSREMLSKSLLLNVCRISSMQRPPPLIFLVSYQSTLLFL